MDFVHELILKGGEVYKVGGCVRNIMYNKIHNTNIAIKDVDILVRLLTLDEIINILKPYGSMKVVGIRFGVIKFTRFLDHNTYDIALPRKEISTGSKYKDFEIISDPFITIEEDFARRDASINAMAIPVFNENDLHRIDHNIDDIIDPFNGIIDIKNKIWRTVGIPYDRFREDPTRIMRAFRQSSELDLDIEPNTKEAIIKNVHLLEIIKKESIVRITDELVRMLKANYKRNLKFFYESKINKILDITDESYKLLMKISIINNTENISLRVKMAFMLCADLDKNEESIKWTKKYELSAASHFSKYDVEFIKCVNSNNVKFPVSEIDIRKLMQSCERISPNYGIEFSCDVLRYYCILYDRQTEIDKLLTIHEHNRHLPLTIAEIKLTGNDIKEINPSISGNEIKNVKTRYFNIITENHIANDRNILMDHYRNQINHSNSILESG